MGALEDGKKEKDRILEGSKQAVQDVIDQGKVKDDISKRKEHLANKKLEKLEVANKEEVDKGKKNLEDVKRSIEKDVEKKVEKVAREEEREAENKIDKVIEKEEGDKKNLKDEEKRTLKT